MAAGAGALFKMVSNGVDVRKVQAHVRKPFRFFLCGDPALVAEFCALLLSGQDDEAIELEAAACLETLGPEGPVHRAAAPDARAIIFLGRGTDASGAHLATLAPLALPILAVTVDATAVPSGPSAAPGPGTWSEYLVPAISREALRTRFFPHLIDCSHGVEIAVGRRLPPLREAAAAKLTRDASSNALKVALASAVVDHIPLVGAVLGAVASAGDTVVITGLQMMLLLQIQATYGKDPDVQRMWQLLPVIGGGLGWRALARELVGFVPLAGIPIKGAIAYAGTMVVGEGVAFFLQNGKHMTKGQASVLYERTKNDALQFARDLAGKFRKQEEPEATVARAAPRRPAAVNPARRRGRTRAGESRSSSARRPIRRQIVPPIQKSLDQGAFLAAHVGGRGVRRFFGDPRSRYAAPTVRLSVAHDDRGGRDVADALVLRGRPAR